MLGKRSAVGCFLAAATAFTCACSSSNVPTSTADATPTPVPSDVPCPTIALEGPQLLYPIPGATGVGVTAGSLVVAGGLPASAIVELVPQAGPLLDLGHLGAVPSPLPEPEATPNGPSNTLAGVPYPGLASDTSYSVMYKDTASPCPIPISSSGETFVTQ